MFPNRQRSDRCKNLMQLQSLLKTSWNYQASQFFQKSTLHGVRYIAELRRPFFEKFMWFCCVTTGAIATTIIIISLWGKFQTNPTITGLDTDFYSWDVAFPALTLCETNPGNETYIETFLEHAWPDAQNKTSIREFLQKLTQLNFENLEGFEKYATGNHLVPIGQTLRTMIYEMTSFCEDILFDCVWKDEPYNCCMGFYPLFTEHGFCYTFNSRHFEKDVPWLKNSISDFKLRYIEETDIKWSFLFNSNSPKMLVFIHNSDEVPSIDTNPQHIWDNRVNKISFTMKQTYTTSDAKQLTIRQRHCIFQDEVKLKIDPTMYTYTACTRQCRMETSQRLCGCVPIFYPEISGFQHCKLKAMACVIKNRKLIENVDKCRCELGCSNTVYEVEKLNERTDKNKASLESEFVSWPMVRYKREVLFGWVDLLVSFGGIAGLFLGFSLLSGVEIIYYFTIRACCMVYRERDEVERMQRDRAMEVKPDYDLSFAPYFKFKPVNGNGVEVILENDNPELLQKIHRPAISFLQKRPRVKRSELFPPPFGIEFLN